MRQLMLANRRCGSSLQVECVPRIARCLLRPESRLKVSALATVAMGPIAIKSTKKGKTAARRSTLTVEPCRVVRPGALASPVSCAVSKRAVRRPQR